MRISDEIDALEVMGLDSVVYLGSTRLLGCWLVLPFVYVIAIVVGITASYLAVVVQIGQVSAGGYLQLFWMFQTPLDFVFSLVKGMAMATFVVLVGIYYGYHAGGGGPVGVGQRDRAVDVRQHPRHPRHRAARHPDLLGVEPAEPDRRMSAPAAHAGPSRWPLPRWSRRWSPSW